MATKTTTSTKPYDPRAQLLALPHPPPTLKPGSGGTDAWAVRLLYRLLAAQGYGDPSWLDPAVAVPDALNAPGSVALLQFRRDRQISNDGGNVGPDTWAWLGCCDPHSLGEVALVFARREAYAGAREIGGNNRGPSVRKYTDGHDGEAWEWCAAYATWCLNQARALLGLSPWDWGSNRFSSSALVRYAAEKGRLYVAPGQSCAPERKRGLACLTGLPGRTGDLCIVRGGKTGYRHTTLCVGIDGDRVRVMEGNVNPARYILALVGVKTGIARPGSYPLSQVVFVRTS